MVAALFKPGWELLAAMVLASLPVLNYQLLVPLPRLMQPLRDRDAQRDPRGAARRALTYRLVWGGTGIVITNVSIIGGLILIFLHGGHIHA